MYRTDSVFCRDTVQSKGGAPVAEKELRKFETYEN